MHKNTGLKLQRKGKSRLAHRIVHIWSAERSSQTIQRLDDGLSVEVSQEASFFTMWWQWRRPWRMPRTSSRPRHVAVSAAAVGVAAVSAWNDFVPLGRRRNNAHSHGQREQDWRIVTRPHLLCETARIQSAIQLGLPVIRRCSVSLPKQFESTAIKHKVRLKITRLIVDNSDTEYLTTKRYGDCQD